MNEALFWNLAFVVACLLWTRDLLALRIATRKLKEFDGGGDKTKHCSNDCN